MASALRLDSQKEFDPSDFLIDLSAAMASRGEPIAEKLRVASYLVRSKMSPKEAAGLLGNGVAADESVSTACYPFASGYPNVQRAVTTATEHGGILIPLRR